MSDSAPPSAASAADFSAATDTLGRRRFLKGLGACLALPVLSSAITRGARAAAAATGANSLGGTEAAGPLRMAFVYFPNGANQAAWWPTGEGAAFTLGRTMQPLAGLKSMIQVVGGLDNKAALAGPDGAGDHARANATFLTGVRVRKTESSDIRAGVSVDQLAAERIGHLTRLPSLELTCDAVRKTGRCDSGYSCAYQNNLSWQSPTTPMSPEGNPRLVFERLFGAGAPQDRQKNFLARQHTQQSLLDYVLDDARSLAGQIDYQDKQKLDEYLTSVREIERRVQNAERFGPLPKADLAQPSGIPTSYTEYVDLMSDLLVMAFKTDSTRIATFLLAAEGSNRPFPEIGVPEAHHFCSHHRNTPELLEKVAKIDSFYMHRFARFLDKLRTTPDVGGKSLLDNSMIVYGCGNGDGNRHSHTNLPVILAGGGGGTLTPGRYVDYKGQPLTNLFLSLTDRMGVHGLERIGDSSGRLAKV